MAYQQLTNITSVQNLIVAIANFAEANGWEKVRSVADGANQTATLRKVGVTDYVHLFNTDASNLRMRPSVGYAAGSSIAGQPGVAGSASVSNQLAGPYPSVWLFADGDEVHVVVRRSDTSGAYSHIAFGCMAKYGDFVGGTYADGSYFEPIGGGGFTGSWTFSGDHGLFGLGDANFGHMRADVDGGTGVWWPTHSGSSGSSTPTATTGVGNLASAGMYTANMRQSARDIARLALAADDNIFSGRTILHVINFDIPRAGSPVYVSPVGYLRNTRFVSLAKLSPEQEVSVASEPWVVFPVVRKATESTLPNAMNASGDAGFAIRKVL